MDYKPKPSSIHINKLSQLIISIGLMAIFLYPPFSTAQARVPTEDEPATKQVQQAARQESEAQYQGKAGLLNIAVDGIDLTESSQVGDTFQTTVRLFTTSSANQSSVSDVASAIGAIDIDLTYDKTALTAIDCTPTEAMEMLACSTTSPGTIQIAGIDSEGLDTGGLDTGGLDTGELDAGDSDNGDSDNGAAQNTILVSVTFAIADTSSQSTTITPVANEVVTALGTPPEIALAPGTIDFDPSDFDPADGTGNPPTQSEVYLPVIR